AWSTRALMYARLIPPGAADVGRFRVTIAGDAQGPLSFTARMNHRKFSWWNTQFSYAGIPDPAQAQAGFAPDFDDRRFIFTGDLSRVSGQLKEIPDLPVTVVAEDKVTVALAPAGGAAPGLRAALGGAVPADQSFDRERFNDYGI